jgi:hypothetical protein
MKNGFRWLKTKYVGMRSGWGSGWINSFSTMIMDRCCSNKLKENDMFEEWSINCYVRLFFFADFTTY